MIHQLFFIVCFLKIPLLGNNLLISFYSLQETFAQWILKAGFSEVTVTDMTLGAVALHSGFKLL